MKYISSLILVVILLGCQSTEPTLLGTWQHIDKDNIKITIDDRFFKVHRSVKMDDGTNIPLIDIYSYTMERDIVKTTYLHTLNSNRNEKLKNYSRPKNSQGQFSIKDGILTLIEKHKTVKLKKI